LTDLEKRKTNSNIYHECGCACFYGISSILGRDAAQKLDHFIIPLATQLEKQGVKPFQIRNDFLSVL